jgi:excisionase family DNA binding protein
MNTTSPNQTSDNASQILPRLAYTMQETAKILGVSYITVHRLLKRGLLKSSRALRHKLIPATEIERFLRESLAAE